MPLTFEALKGQRYRWCFGGIQILRLHWRSLVPGRKSKENHLTTAQRWAYLAGGVQWYGDFLGLAFLVFLLAGAANEALGGGALFRKLTVFLLATVPVLVLLGLVRASRCARGTGASWRDAIGAFFIWQSSRSWWRVRPCSGCSRARRRSCGPQGPASRPGGGRRCRPTGQSHRSPSSGWQASPRRDQPHS
jgi:hypothetical protein